MDWQSKQAQLQSFLTSQGAEESPCRVDLTKGKIYWIDDFGLSLAVADCKVIHSFALSNNSVLMSWANSSLSEEAALEPIEGFEELYPDSEPEQAWELAVNAAEAVNAEAVYRVPSPQSWVFLALWNPRPGGAEQFTSGSPKEHVLQVLESLLEHPELEERQVLIDNYAESFLQMASHPYKGTYFQGRLQETARKLRNLLVFGDDKQNEGLIALKIGWLAEDLED